MSEVIKFPAEDYRTLAVHKIAEELNSFKGDRYGEAVKKHVAATLTHFCEENIRFAEVVYKTKRTLSDCVSEIMRGCGQSISDIDVYRGAVRNYFPNADVEFHMTITINGAAPTEEELNREVKKPEPKKSAPKPVKTEQKKAATEQKVAPAVQKTTKTSKKPEKPAEKQEPEIIQLSLW